MVALIFVLCLNFSIVVLTLWLWRRRYKQDQRNREHVEQLRKANEYIRWLEDRWEDNNR